MKCVSIEWSCWLIRKSRTRTVYIMFGARLFVSMFILFVFVNRNCIGFISQDEGRTCRLWCFRRVYQSSLFEAWLGRRRWWVSIFSCWAVITNILRFYRLPTQPTPTRRFGFMKQSSSLSLLWAAYLISTSFDRIF